MSRRARSYRRLDVEERRRRLLDLGTEIFARQSYDEVSMAAVARAAGISKALLYHYFPGKQAMFRAVLEHKAAELEARMPAGGAAAPQDVEAGLRAFLEWVDENREAYATFLRSSGIPEVRALTQRVREDTIARIADVAGGGARTRGAVRAWLWFLDGAIASWLVHAELGREEVARAALGALRGALGS